jgi:hypothetical protein
VRSSGSGFGAVDVSAMAGPTILCLRWRHGLGCGSQDRRRVLPGRGQMIEVAVTGLPRLDDDTCGDATRDQETRTSCSMAIVISIFHMFRCYSLFGVAESQH